MTPYPSSATGSLCLLICLTHDRVSLSRVDDDGDGDVVLYSAVTPCCCNMLGALGTVVI